MNERYVIYEQINNIYWWNNINILLSFRFVIVFWNFVLCKQTFFLFVFLWVSKYNNITSRFIFLLIPLFYTNHTPPISDRIICWNIYLDLPSPLTLSYFSQTPMKIIALFLSLSFLSFLLSQFEIYFIFFFVFVHKNPEIGVSNYYQLFWFSIPITLLLWPPISD